MNPFKFFLVTALAVFASTLDAHAGNDVLKVYTTTDPNEAKDKPTGLPGDAWDSHAAGDPITIAAGETMWFSFLNTFDKGKHKYFRYELSAPAGGGFGLTLVNAAAFDGDDDSAPVAQRPGISFQNGHLIVREYRFTPQPTWERVAYKNAPGGAPVIVEVSALSVCADIRPDVLSSALTVNAASIGSASLGAMYGTPRYSAIWIFPASNPVDPLANQLFSAPPASGTWQASVVNQTPLGDPRPLGGVVWRTLGPGVRPDENFGLVLAMQGIPGDNLFEFYAFDASSQQTLQVSLDLNQLEPISYCTAKINSLGCTPAIASQGTSSASAQGGFLVTCAQMRNNKPGVLLYSLQGRAANPFQGGRLCVAPAIRRSVGLSSGGNPGPANDCSGRFAIDMNAFAAGQLGGTPAQELRQPGRAVDCQWWSRDPQAQFGSSLSDALEYVVGN